MVGRVPTDQNLVHCSEHTRAGKQGNFKQLQANCETCRNSFYPKTIIDWNSLSTELKKAQSLEVFKSGLHKLCQ